MAEKAGNEIVKADDGELFKITMAASNVDDKSTFYTDEIEIDKELLGFLYVEENFDSDGDAISEDDIEGFYLNPAQVLMIETFAKGSSDDETEEETEEESEEEAEKPQKKSSEESLSVSERGRKKQGWWPF